MNANYPEGVGDDLDIEPFPLISFLAAYFLARVLKEYAFAVTPNTGKGNVAYEMILAVSADIAIIFDDESSFQTFDRKSFQDFKAFKLLYHKSKKKK